MVVPAGAEAAAHLTGWEDRRVDVRIGRTRPDRLQYLGEAGRSGVDSLLGTWDDVGRGERSSYGRRGGGASLRNRHAGRMCQIRAQEEHDQSADRGSAEVNVGLGDRR